MKLTFYILLFGAITLLGGSLVIEGDRTSSKKRAELVVRDIGHHLLLKSGDSTSRILPVSQVDDHTFRIEFANEFAFVPDTLAEVVHQRLSSAGLPRDYRVRVLECGNPRMIFGYEMSTRDNDVLPCFGRNQHTGCYVIELEFTEGPSFMEIHRTVLFSGMVIALALTMFFAGRKKTVPLQPEEGNGSIRLGSYTFYFDRKILQSGRESIELSDKEAKLLRIFALHQNQAVERDRLLKEVWENEGIFVVGRSLDVFVSKLRKKLQHDGRIKITNIHGRGYKLEVAEG